MGGVPGDVAAGGTAIGAVGVADANAAFPAAGVVFTGVVGGIGVGAAVRLGAGNQVVLVRCSAHAIDLRAFFGEVGGAMHVVAQLA